MNAITLYRFGNWCYRKKIPFLPRLVRYAIFLLFNSDVCSETTIGPGTYFAHGGIGVVINPKSTIGSNVSIGPHVLIGGNFRDGVPTIGDNVWISPGAKILGNVSIGSNVVIGANAVVLIDVPDSCIAAGVPATIIRQTDSFILEAMDRELVRRGSRSTVNHSEQVEAS